MSTFLIMRLIVGRVYHAVALTALALAYSGLLLNVCESTSPKQNEQKLLNRFSGA